MIRQTALLLALAVAPVASFGGGSSVHHYISQRLSCSQAKRVVNSEGAVILHYGNDLYQRVVAHRGFCEMDETTIPLQLPTSDLRACFVGMGCEANRNGGGGESGGSGGGEGGQ